MRVLRVCQRDCLAGGYRWSLNEANKGTSDATVAFKGAEEPLKKAGRSVNGPGDQTGFGLPGPLQGPRWVPKGVPQKVELTRVGTYPALYALQQTAKRD